MLRTARLLLLFLLLLTVLSARADGSPLGLWRTIDDATGKPKSLVRITEHGGELRGRIEQLIDPRIPDPPCDQCTDERKDKPILGMIILWGARRSGTDSAEWDSGEILDPENGKVYRVRLRPTEDGRQLDVRGYIGVPLFGRTQRWIRVD